MRQKFVSSQGGRKDDRSPPRERDGSKDVPPPSPEMSPPPRFYSNHVKRESDDESTAMSYRRSFASPTKDDLPSTNFYAGDDVVPTMTMAMAGLRKSDPDDEDDDRGDAPSPKRIKLEAGVKQPNSKQPHYADNAKNMMMKMGYKEGTGLGKHSQGRVDIIETSKQRGRRGLGLHLEGLEPSLEIDWEKEEVTARETIEWMPECKEEPPMMDELRSWVQEGKKKLTIEDETEFCSETILRKVLHCKSVFDQLEPDEMRKARTRSNPFETVRGVIFQNRAAMKMANMDAMFDFMFTNPVTADGKSMVGPNDLLYFADVCAGPGGFSEYVLFRKKWEAKGFGFTLKGSNDFKLEEFHAGPTETFEPHYGVNGYEGDGDVYVPENLREFRHFVLETTEDKGVHFVMADGGFSVEGQENIQEILSKRLYLCQFLCALSILRTGGHFVCKVFDLFTSFSAGLIYLLYRAFERICIVKPNTSRPANSERYVVCKWKRTDTKDIHDYMFEVNCRLGQLQNDTVNDVVEIVPLHVLKDDVKFCNYVTRSNEMLGQQQILHLAKIQAFCQNTDLYEERQSDLRKECLKIWQIPDKARCAVLRPEPMSKFRELKQDEDADFLNYAADTLDAKKLDAIRSVHDYRCVVLGASVSESNLRGFFIGLGRTQVYRWEGSSRGKWIKENLSVEIPNDTLVFAEIVQELRGEGKGQRKLNTLHIIDAVFLGGKDIRNLHYTERVAEITKFVKAIHKPSRPSFAPVRVKEVYRLQEISSIFDRLQEKFVKGRGGIRRLCYCCDEERYFVPHGVLFLKTVKEPWTIAFSRSKNTKYFFNHRTGDSRFDAPREAIATFRECYFRRLQWLWDQGVKIHDSQETADDGKIHRDTVLERIQRFSK